MNSFERSSGWILLVRLGGAFSRGGAGRLGFAWVGIKGVTFRRGSCRRFRAAAVLEDISQRETRVPSQV